MEAAYEGLVDFAGAGVEVVEKAVSSINGSLF